MILNLSIESDYDFLSDGRTQIQRLQHIRVRERAWIQERVHQETSRRERFLRQSPQS